MPALPPAPPALQAPAPVDARQKAEDALLDAYDMGSTFPNAEVHGAAALSYQWLRTALTFEVSGPAPRNPFPAGARHHEVQALLALMKQPQGLTAQDLAKVPLKESGTALALWRWGQQKVQAGTMAQAPRRAWEDRLITVGPPLSRGYALRHALCFALAEGDEARFAAIRALSDPSTADIVTGFQRLFGMLGGPLPIVRLWSLPGLDYQDLELSQFHHIWIYPMDDGPLPKLPDDTTWIIPSVVGGLDERSATLDEPTRKEGEALANHLREGGHQAWFAPSRTTLEHLGLDWFPALLELDAKGDLLRVRMGDAAPRKP